MNAALRIALVVVVSSVLGGSRATGELPADDGVPSGTVAFFSVDEGTGCPPGWLPASDVAGRLVVGVNQPNEVGVQVGAPLGDQEDRMHAHAYTGVLSLPAKNIAAADGGNGAGAAAGDHAIDSTTGAATSGLPFVQLLVCEKP